MSRLQPESSAICSWDGELSYKELNELSSTLAHHLVDHGAGPESLVGICFNKSLWTDLSVVAMLATLKAGAGFVPLNPDHPEERLRDIVDQMQSHIILVAPQYQTLCQNLVETVIPVSQRSISQLLAYHEKPKTMVTPNNTAYVLFTSGSTGKPKVMHFSLSLKHDVKCAKGRVRVL
ncbi:hypothetical protein HYFRA_00014075 [Hymenoscyphus fraxineus]|uniref:AMP-dependent synthetase/ligase domain-containing protein n=1 Tax=Hymenoscyphus fraxineus TaxID=746836 RepID=A0A9N9LAH5_9HELO|nr:hypothetical protein HYFRA_00014075 [Hymenoscyphus fraxineus]